MEKIFLYDELSLQIRSKIFLLQEFKRECSNNHNDPELKIVMAAEIAKISKALKDKKFKRSLILRNMYSENKDKD